MQGRVIGVDGGLPAKVATGERERERETDRYIHICRANVVSWELIEACFFLFPFFVLGVESCLIHNDP